MVLHSSRNSKQKLSFISCKGYWTNCNVQHRPKEFVESVILTNEGHRRVLKTWLPIKSEWRLLFRASRDGFAALAFHFKCDNKGPTITVVKSGRNIFGGFTEKAWTSKIN